MELKTKASEPWAHFGPGIALQCSHVTRTTAIPWRGMPPSADGINRQPTQQPNSRLAAHQVFHWMAPPGASDGAKSGRLVRSCLTERRRAAVWYMGVRPERMRWPMANTYSSRACCASEAVCPPQAGSQATNNEYRILATRQMTWEQCRAHSGRLHKRVGNAI